MARRKRLSREMVKNVTSKRRIWMDKFEGYDIVHLKQCIRQHFQEFLKFTTIPGAVRLSTGSFGASKMFWILCLLAAGSLVILQSVLLTQDYMEQMFSFNNLYYGNCFTFNHALNHSKLVSSPTSVGNCILEDDVHFKLDQCNCPQQCSEEIYSYNFFWDKQWLKQSVWQLFIKEITTTSRGFGEDVIYLEVLFSTNQLVTSIETPLITKYLDHVHELETTKSIEGADLYEKEFQNLKTLSDEVRTAPQYSCSIGEQDVNRRKNRYKDILPYDVNRVTLKEISGVPGSDYINASFIKGASGSVAYIASQAPLPHTVEDFWRMIWECEVQVIVMASNEVEGGRHKCERYWPNKGETKQFSNITVTLVEQREMCSDYDVRHLQVVCDDVTRRLHQFHYHNWPDHGVPQSVRPLLDMVGLVREFQVSETLPLLVHCSAGCGRTGTVCATDFVWGLLRAGKLTEDFSIKQLVLDMRKQRIAMVQTKEQYVLVHRAVKELFEEHLKVIDSHPYENIDFSGRPLALQDEPDYENLRTGVNEQDLQKRNELNIMGEPKDSNLMENLDKQGHITSSTTNNNTEHNEKDVSFEKMLLPRDTLDPLPPLPAKTKVGNTCQKDTVTTLASEKRSPTPGRCCSSELSSDVGSRQSQHSSRDQESSPSAAPGLQCDSRTRMEYVNDWCEGIVSSSNQTSDKGDGEQERENGGAFANGLRRYSAPKITATRHSTAGSSTPNLSSSSPSPNTSKKSGEVGRKSASPDPQRLKKGATRVDAGHRVSNLVRKPSIAKLRALFESNTDSSASGSPSPEVAKQADVETRPTAAPEDASDSSEVKIRKHRTRTSSNNDKKKKKLCLDQDEYDAMMARYEDTAFRIFQDTCRVKNEPPPPPRTTSSSSSSTVTKGQLAGCSSPSSSARSDSYTVSGVSTDNQEEEEEGEGGKEVPSLRTRKKSDEDRTSSSADEVSRRGSIRSDRSRSPSLPPHTADTSQASVTDVTTATAGDSNNSSATSTTSIAKELVGRLAIRQRHHSNSAEKRNSTWYDDDNVAEMQKDSSNSNAPSNLQNRVALFFSGGSLEKKKASKEKSSPVKRSTSMKVGFIRSPLFLRRHRNPVDTSSSDGSHHATAYLALEGSPKVISKRAKPTTRWLVPTDSTTASDEQSADVDSKQQQHRQHGELVSHYANVKPTQKPVSYSIGNHAVELTKFRARYDESDLMTRSDGCLPPPMSPPRRRYLRVDGDHLASSKKVMAKRGSNSPYVSPATTRRRNESVETDRNLNNFSFLDNDAIHPTSWSRSRPGCDRAVDMDALGVPSIATTEKASQCEIVTAPGHDQLDSRLIHLPAERPLSPSPSSPRPSGKHRSASFRQPLPSPSRDSFFGTDMDAYCQKIIQDCQQYLVSHEYTNLTPEAQRNIRWIEKTLQQSPRGAILDVLSASAALVPSDLPADHRQQQQRGSSGHDYEKLWLSRSGVRSDSAVAPCSKDDGLDSESTSVEEMSLIFPPEDRDPLGGRSGSSKREIQERGVISGDDEIKEYNSDEPRFTSSGQANCSSASSSSGNAGYDKTFEELNALINELDTEASNPKKPRKPKPAPRTILNTGSSRGSPVDCCEKAPNEEIDRGPVMAIEEKLIKASNHNYENVGQMRFLESAGPSARQETGHRLQPRVEYSIPLRSSPVHCKGEQQQQHHEYEEIVFRDGRGVHWVSRSPIPPPPPPLSHQHHIYERLREDAKQPVGSKGCVLPERELEPGASRLYGQVQKPRRKKHSLGGPSDPLVVALSGNGSGNHVGSGKNTPLQPSLPMADVGHSAAPWSRQLPPGQELSLHQQKPQFHDYESLIVPAKYKEWKSAEVDNGRPIAPPRLRRNNSSSTVKTYLDFHTKESAKEPTMKITSGRGYDDNEWAVPRHKWETEFDNNDEDEEDIPPVPIKTKDAYRLPKAETSPNSNSLIPDNAAVGTHPTTSGLSKALNKLHTTFLSKLVIKNDRDSSDTSSAGSGNGTPPTSRKASQKNTGGLGFPNRLDSKPKGPRDPPAHWKVIA